MMAKRAFAPKTIADPLSYHEQSCKNEQDLWPKDLCHG